jgi:hypothetical protein
VRYILINRWKVQSMPDFDPAVDAETVIKQLERAGTSLRWVSISPYWVLKTLRTLVAERDVERANAQTLDAICANLQDECELLRARVQQLERAGNIGMERC